MADDPATRALVTLGMIDPAAAAALPSGLSSDTWPGALVTAGLQGDALDQAMEVVRHADGTLSAQEVTPESEGRYARVELLGAGGMGQVALVDDLHLHRQVARKELHAQRPAIALRFLREARVTAQLEHPGIVPVYELGRGPTGRLYYTMKRVRGRTLRDALDACTSLQDRLGLLSAFVEVCHAVGYAHSKGVVHRDLKPENVMIGPFGETLVLDWGLAKVAGEPELTGGSAGSGLGSGVGSGSASDLTRAGTVMGTPKYMAPEQADGRLADIDPRSDVWSLGVVLYEILAGEVPFDGPADSVIRQVRQGVVSPVQEAVTGVPPELAAICGKALGSTRAERYDHAGELADEIEAWRAGATVGAHVYTPVQQARRLADRFRVALAVGCACALAVGASWAWWTPGIRDAHQRADAADARARFLEGLLAAESWADDDPATALALVREAARGREGADQALADARVDALIRAGGDQRAFAVGSGAGAPFWSRTGTALAWSDAEGVQVVDPVSGAGFGRVQAPGARAAAFGPDDSTILVVGDGGLREFALVDGREVRAVELPFEATGIAVSGGAITVDGDGRSAYVDLSAGRAVERPAVPGPAHDPRTWARGADRVEARGGRVAVTFGGASWTVPVGAEIRAVSPSPSGAELAVATPDAVRLLSLGPPSRTPVTNLRVCPDGRVVPVLPFPRASDLDPGKACAL